MRREFIMCKTRRTAQRRAPWAAVLVKAEGGWWAFESSADARMWQQQR